MRSRARARSLAEALGIDRFNIFVPAMMSVGLIFWLTSEVRELLRSSDKASREKRAIIHGHAVARMTTGAGDPGVPLGLRPRVVYALVGAVLVAGAVYVIVGSVANYGRPGGYVSNIAWLLALANTVSLVALLYSAAAIITVATWPRPPPVVRPLLTHSPLTADPTAQEAGHGSAWAGAGFTIATIGAVVASLVVGVSPHRLHWFDQRIAQWWAELETPGWTMVSGALYRTETVLVLVVLVCAAAVRCRALAIAYAAATGIGIVVATALHGFLEPRPLGQSVGAVVEYPSSHVINAVLMAAFVPLAASLVTNRARLVVPLELTLAGAAMLTAVNQIADGSHWPSDVLGGALIGMSLAFGARWVLTRNRAHALCRGCPWSSRAPSHHHARGLIPLNPTAKSLVRVVAHVSAAAAAIGLAIMTVTIGLPANTEDYVFGAGIERPVQLALAGVVSVGALLAWKWEVLGAILIALAATGLGLFAAIEYQPKYAVILATAVMIPAVLLWLSWQHQRNAWELTTVALVTVSLLGTTWIGANRVYDSYFGATHASSAAPLLDVDRVEWMWAGALRTDGITVTARLAAGHETAQLVVESVSDQGAIHSSVARPDEHRVVRLTVSGLEPETPYSYRILVDGIADTSRGDGRFRTPADGPMSYRVAIGACARTGSNAAVFDAIAAMDPLVYLAVGDIHYSNIESASIDPFLAAYDYLLTRPGQAALYRSTPIAYVWDDHDYGANDAGASSPGRSAARAAYRRMVPHYPVPAGDEPINQAFTIGRVRFVVTDDRSEQDATTMLGEEQLSWLIDELTESSKTHALVVWASSVPWIGAARADGDGWAAHPDERQRIADAIATADVNNLIMVSGDAHMVAIDDGTNSDYANGGGGGFPVLHAAALDRPGGVKGGPYSEGAFPGAGQFGLLDIIDDGEELTVRLEGRTWEGNLLTDLQLTVSNSTHHLVESP